MERWEHIKSINHCISGMPSINHLLANTPCTSSTWTRSMPTIERWEPVISQSIHPSAAYHHQSFTSLSMYFFHMDQKFSCNVEVITSNQSIHPSAVQYTINQSYTSLTMHFSHMDQKFAYNREVRASNQSIHQLLAINQSCTYLTMLFFHMDQKFA